MTAQLVLHLCCAGCWQKLQNGHEVAPIRFYNLSTKVPCCWCREIRTSFTFVAAPMGEECTHG